MTPIVIRQENDRKAAAVQETWINGPNGSPPLTSSLHSRRSASSAQESKYLQQTRALRWTRLGLALLVLVASLLVLGCAANVLRRYNATHLDAHWMLQLWPLTLNVKPTTTEAVVGTLSTCGTLLYLASAWIPSPHSKNHTQNWVFGLTSALGLIVSLVAVIYVNFQSGRVDSTNRDTIESWTCRFYRGAQDFAQTADELRLPVSAESLVPQGFRRLCIEAAISRWSLVAMLVLQLCAMTVAGLGMAVEHRIGRQRASRYAPAKSSFEA